MTKPLKPPLSHQQQIELLKSRKLKINDENIALIALSDINYYRLISAYSLGKYTDYTKSQYKSDCSFEHLLRIYSFDCRLRNLLAPLIEAVELRLRAKFAYHFALKYGALGYMDSANFKNKALHAKFLEYFTNEKQRQKKYPLVSHHNKEYGGNIPVWAAVEIVSFGELSKLIANLNEEDLRVVAREMTNHNKYKAKSDVLTSWTCSLVEIRNICAHYGRLYNRSFKSSPKLYKEHSALEKDKLFASILVLKYLTRAEKEFNDFICALEKLFEEFDEIDIIQLGFPSNWRDMLARIKRKK